MNYFSNYILRFRQFGQFTLWCIFSITLIIPINAYARSLGSLPHEEHFDSASSYSDIVKTTEGATHTFMPDGGWRGGAAKFTPPVIYQGYSGLGQLQNLLGRDGGPVTRLNVRFLIYHGSTWSNLGPNSKVIITNRDVGPRSMIISRRKEASPTDTTILYESYGACMNTTCTYYGGIGWPDGTDTLRIGDPPLNREQEWISVEIESDTVTGRIRMYLHTQDGELNGLYVERDTNTGGIWQYIDIIGGYMDEAPADPNNYFMIDELKVDTQYIGPPEGFLSDPPPGQPDELITTPQ